ncbi:MAG: hypothetical protein WCG03_10290 [Kiritimatiellales bacterium]
MRHAVEECVIHDRAFVDYRNEAKGLAWTVDDLIGIWRSQAASLFSPASIIDSNRNRAGHIRIRKPLPAQSDLHLLDICHTELI